MVPPPYHQPVYFFLYLLQDAVEDVLVGGGRVKEYPAENRPGRISHPPQFVTVNAVGGENGTGTLIGTEQGDHLEGEHAQSVPGFFKK